MLHRSLAALAAVCLVTLALLRPAAPAEAQTGLFENQNIASETYYTLNSEEGTIDVRIEARVQNASGARTSTVLFLLMPGATDVQVLDGETPVNSVRTPSNPELEFVSTALTDYVEFLEVTAAEELVPNIAREFTVTYTLGQRQGELFTISPGVIDAALVSQGPGSFVYIDVPAGGDNYFDPGCLLAADQSGAASGAERWICGETALIALNANNPSLLEECAAAATRCRQKIETYYGGFAQSVTDPSLQGFLEDTVELKSGPVVLTFRFFQRDRVWAQSQFDVARRALPELEAIFGFPYPFERVELQQSNFIGILGLAGIAFSSLGQAYLAPDFEAGVTVHELAHQWAGLTQIQQNWIWEGLAEYATRRAGPALGVPGTFTATWESYGVEVPLTQFGRVPPFDSGYWYRRAGDFFFELEAAIGGPEAMTKLLAQMGVEQDSWPLADRWFQDRGEELFDKNLDQLFLDWMYVPLTAGPVLQERRAVWTLVDELVARAATIGLAGVPAGLRPNLDGWIFDAARDDIAAMHGMLDDYFEVFVNARDAGLPRADSAIQQAWQHEPLHIVEQRIREQQNAIDAILAARATVGEDAPPLAVERLAEATDTYVAGDYSEASRLARRAESLVVVVGNAELLIDRATEREAGFHANPLQQIGLIFADPSGDLARARQAFANDEPEKAIVLAQSAIDDWDGSQRQGALYLAVVLAILGIGSIGGYALIGARNSAGERDARTAAAMAARQQRPLKPEKQIDIGQPSAGTKVYQPRPQRERRRLPGTDERGGKMSRPGGD